MTKWMIVAGVVLWASAAGAAEQPRFAPPAAWVKPLPIPDLAPGSDGVITQLLLHDNQARMAPDGVEIYDETAFKILAPQGQSRLATIPFNWSPDTETLTIHRVQIIRDGKAIDLLDGGKALTILRRETNLEHSMLDGRLTASLQPQGLQVGDIVNIATTRERHDPVLKGHSEAVYAVRHQGVAGRIRLRAIWADGKPIRWRITDGLPTPVLTHRGNQTELVVDQSNVTAAQPPRNAPGRFREVGQLELSQFQTWAEVSSIMAPLYAKAAAVTPGSPLAIELEKIRKASPDPKARTEAALRLVQDQVHYVFLGMNFGGYIPADAEVTWQRRFGDCKGKTALLLALLHGLGIEAQAAMVSTAFGDGLASRLPMLGVFDHVFVRAVVGGKTYWLDGTRTGDRSLDDIPLPDFRWVLPVQSAAAQLERVEPSPLQKPHFESLKLIDNSAGYDAPAKVRAEQTFRGDSSTAWRTGLRSLSRTEAERRLREYWRTQIYWVEPREVSFKDDEQHSVLTLTMDGEGKVDWTPNADILDFDIGDSSLGFTTSFKREPGPNADAPFSVPYPSYSVRTVKITLPDKGAGFRLLNARDVDSTLAGRRYQRHARLIGGVVTMSAQEQSLASEFPNAEASTAAVALRALNAHDIVVRGPRRPLSALIDDDIPEHPVNAAGFSHRAVGYLMRYDYDRAIADFSTAARLEPNNGQHLYNRGGARLRNRDDAGAMVDFNAALRLDPKNSLAYQARAELLARRGDKAQAWRDFGQAIKLSPGDTKVIRRRAAAYAAAGLYAESVRDLDTLIEQAARTDARMKLLNERCWVRAAWGQELNKALADCNAALALEPGAAAILDSRAFVQLRSGQYKLAIQDYDAALSQAPDQASSLYGRGLAKLHEGRRSDGEADIASARMANPDIDAEFARYGIADELP